MEKTQRRPWLYHTPEDILIKASQTEPAILEIIGQPLFVDRSFTFEHFENLKNMYDNKSPWNRNWAKKKDSEKNVPEKGDLLYCLAVITNPIGMGGGAVSSVEYRQIRQSMS